MQASRVCSLVLPRQTERFGGLHKCRDHARLYGRGHQTRVVGRVLVAQRRQAEPAGFALRRLKALLRCAAAQQGAPLMPSDSAMGGMHDHDHA